MNKALVASLVVALSLAGCGGDDGGGGSSSAPAARDYSTAYASVDESLMVTTADATAMLKKKDDDGPAYVASPKWKDFLLYLEDNMRAIGMVDFVRYTFPYDRWYTTEWPDRSGWSLVSDGTRVDVASYATFSGSTGAGGVTAPLVLYDLNAPAASRPTLAQMRGKIVVLRQQLYSTVTSGSSLGDYEYITDAATFTPPGRVVPVTADADYRNRAQSGTAMAQGINLCQAAGAVGAVWVLDMSNQAAQAWRQHPTPANYNCPGVAVDRVAGVKVVADAVAGKTATVTLNAQVERNSLPWQLVGYLPGKYYGTDRDQRVLLSTHTDGMSNVEDNGALGILATLKYYARIPRDQRPRTLMIFLDNRHFIAGGEGGNPYDYFDDFSNAAQYLVGGVAMEHFGGKQYVEEGESYHETGLPAHTYIFTYPNPLAIEQATQVMKDLNVRRGVVAAPVDPGYQGLYNTTGVNGLSQGAWYGANFMLPMSENGHLPGWHVSGDWPSAGIQAYYPALGTRVDPEYFRQNVRMAVRMVGVLLKTDLSQIAPDWGFVRTNLKTLADADFTNASAATATRAALLAQFDTIFAAVRRSDYATAKSLLPGLRGAVVSAVTPGTKATNLTTQIDAVTAIATAGPKLPPA